MFAFRSPHRNLKKRKWHDFMDWLLWLLIATFTEFACQLLSQIAYFLLPLC